VPALSLELTPAEQTWLAEHPQLRLGVDRDWPPYEFIDTDEQYQGLAADYVRLIEQRLPITLRPAPAQNWSEVLADARTGKLHLLPSLMATPERQQYLTFTRPYLDFPIVILSQEQGPQPRRLRELQGLRVAVVDSYATHELLRDKHPELRLWPRPNVAAALQALASGQADAIGRRSRLQRLAPASTQARRHHHQRPDPVSLPAGDGRTQGSSDPGRHSRQTASRTHPQ
jgi:ABC-type amino acid transport substrate-binding protein